MSNYYKAKLVLDCHDTCGKFSNLGLEAQVDGFFTSKTDPKMEKFRMGKSAFEEMQDNCAKHLKDFCIGVELYFSCTDLKTNLMFKDEEEVTLKLSKLQVRAIIKLLELDYPANLSEKILEYSIKGCDAFLFLSTIQEYDIKLKT